MKHTYFVGIDIGTSSTKTGLWRDDGHPAAETVAEYPVYRPHPSWAEMDALDWWNATCQTVRQAVLQGDIATEDIVGVGVDGLSGSLVAVDMEGKPLRPAPIWQDRRSQAEADELKALPEARHLINLNPNPLDPAHSTSKVLWLANQEPDVFEKAHLFLSSSGFIVHRLTGEFTCDHTQAFDYHFFDTRKARWDEYAAALIGIPLDKFPRLHQSCEIVGRITKDAAQATGLREGIPVIAGGLDACVGSLGVGVARPGQTVDQGGQAGGMALVLDHIVVEPRLMFSHHVVPGRFILHSGTVGGGSLRWFRDTLGQWEVSAAQLLKCSPFSLMSQQVEETAPGAHGLIFLPYMAGERSPIWNSNARGVLFGLSYKTTRGDILRAIMEGCALAVQHNTRIAAEHDALVREWIGVGGATRSDAWCQIKADVSNSPFVVARRADGGEGGHTLGLTAMIRKALGMCDDLAEQMETYLPRRRVFEPSAERHAMYQDLLEVYLALSAKLQSDFAELAALVAAHPKFLAPED